MDYGFGCIPSFFLSARYKNLRESHIFVSFLCSKRPLAWTGRGLAKEARHQACSNATSSPGAIALRKIAAEKNVIGHRGQLISIVWSTSPNARSHFATAAPLRQSRTLLSRYYVLAAPSARAG